MGMGARPAKGRILALKLVDAARSHPHGRSKNATSLFRGELLRMKALVHIATTPGFGKMASGRRLYLESLREAFCSRTSNAKTINLVNECSVQSRQGKVQCSPLCADVICSSIPKSPVQSQILPRGNVRRLSHLRFCLVLQK